jgi:hypothetical protein
MNGCKRIEEKCLKEKYRRNSIESNLVRRKYRSYEASKIFRCRY